MSLPANGSLPGSPVSRWKLTEASGSRADSVGSNTLTDNNTVTSSTGPYSDTCALFTAASTEFLNITDGTQSGLDITSNLSFGCWIYLNSTPGTDTAYTIMSKYASTGSQRGYVLNYQDTAGTKALQVVLSSNGTATATATYTVTLSTSTWYHVGFTYDSAVSSGQVVIYKDGTSGSTTNTMGASIFNNTADFQLGQWSNLASNFDGRMQDAVIWNTTLTSGNWTTYYNAYTASTVKTLAATGVG